MLQREIEVQECVEVVRELHPVRLGNQPLVLHPLAARGQRCGFADWFRKPPFRRPDSYWPAIKGLAPDWADISAF